MPAYTLQSNIQVTAQKFTCSANKIFTKNATCSFYRKNNIDYFTVEMYPNAGVVVDNIFVLNIIF